MYDLTNKLDRLNLAQLRDLVNDIFDELYVEGPDTEWNPDNIEAIANRLMQAGIPRPLWCETNNDEASDNINAAFAVSDHYLQHEDDEEVEDLGVDVFFEHGQWFVRLSLDLKEGVERDQVTFTYSVNDTDKSPDEFSFEEL